MAAILNRCVPSRRQERKRQRAMQVDLDTRFGDTHISSPSDGAWNQKGGDADVDDLSVASPASLTQDMAGLSMQPDSLSPIERGSRNDSTSSDTNRNTFTITIPLPWPARKVHSRDAASNQPAPSSDRRKDTRADLNPGSLTSPEYTPKSFASSPDPSLRSDVSSPQTSAPSQSTSPVTIYKPISEEYNQYLADMGSRALRLSTMPSVPQDRTPDVSPVEAIYRPATEDYLKEMAGVGMGPSPLIQQAESNSRSRLPSKPLLTRTLPPESKSKSPCNSPDSHKPVAGLPSFPRPPSSHKCSPPQSFTRPQSRDEANNSLSDSRGKVPVIQEAPRVRARSVSRGPPRERIGTTRSSSTTRLSTMRSSSRDPANSYRIPYRESVSSDSSGCTETRSTASASSPKPPFAFHGATILPITESEQVNSMTYRTCHPVHRQSRSLASIPGDAGVALTSAAVTRVGSHPHSPPNMPQSLSAGSGISSDSSNSASTSSSGTGGAGAGAGGGGGGGYYSSVAEDYRRIASEQEEEEMQRRRLEPEKRTWTKRRDTFWGKDVEKAKEAGRPREVREVQVTRASADRDMVASSNELW